MLNSNFFKAYCIVFFFSSHGLHQFPFHNEKKSHKKVCFFQKTVNNSSFACQLTAFSLQQRKNQNKHSVIVVKTLFQCTRIFEVLQGCSQCYVMSYCYIILNRSILNTCIVSVLKSTLGRRQGTGFIDL